MLENLQTINELAMTLTQDIEELLRDDDFQEKLDKWDQCSQGQKKFS